MVKPMSIATVIPKDAEVKVRRDDIVSDPSASIVRARAIVETIEEIGTSAFEDTGLKSFTFHPNIKKIGDSAFAATALTEVTIPSTIEEIGTYAFVDCKNLRKINISKKWKDITLIVEIFGNDPHIITSHNLDECKIFNWID